MTSFQRQTESVRTRADFVAFVRLLVHDSEDNAREWENDNLQSYLAAIANWADDMPGYYANRGEVTPPEPTWRVFAEILAAATIYE